MERDYLWLQLCTKYRSRSLVSGCICVERTQRVHRQPQEKSLPESCIPIGQPTMKEVHGLPFWGIKNVKDVKE